VLTNADRFRLKPLIQAATAARKYLESVQAEWNSVQQQRDATQSQLDRLRSRQNQPNIDQEQIYQQIRYCETRLWDIDHYESPPLASKLQDARVKSDEAAAKEKQLEDQLLQAHKQQLAEWGPVAVRTTDASLLSKHHGAICSVRVRVEAVDVAMTRIPDGAGWNFSSDAPDKAETRSPTADDDSGPGAVPPYVSSKITVRCVEAEQGQAAQ
jgi:septal ring factor EnvC (AmiA/AmiB activator)